MREARSAPVAHANKRGGTAPLGTGREVKTSAKPSERGLTPNQLAHRYRIGIHKILGWIARGELRAINVATDLGVRPQWKILPEHLEAFEARRAAAPKPAAPKKRRLKETGVIPYF